MYFVKYVDSKLKYYTHYGDTIFSIMCIMGLNITDQLEQERSEPLQKYNPLSITKRTTDFEGEISTL